MTEIIFLHDDWTVVTSSWSVASKKPNKIVICYPWSGLSGISMWGDSSTGVARIELDLSMAVFLERTKLGNRLDLRAYQKS